MQVMQGVPFGNRSWELGPGLGLGGARAEFGPEVPSGNRLGQFSYLDSGVKALRCSRL